MAFIFVPLLAATGIMTFLVLMFTAYYVFNGTSAVAAGDEQVNWPDEGILDRFIPGLQFGVMAAFYVMPVGLLAALLSRGDPVVFLPFCGLAYWLFFPIALLSVLGASSKWVAFDPTLLGRMAQRPGDVLAFYARSFPVVILMTAAVTLGPTRFGNIAAALISGPVVGCGLFLHFWLVGRLGYALRHTRDHFGEHVEARQAKRDRRDKFLADRRFGNDLPMHLGRDGVVEPIPDEGPVRLSNPYSREEIGSYAFRDDATIAEREPDKPRPNYIDVDLVPMEFAKEDGPGRPGDAPVLGSAIVARQKDIDLYDKNRRRPPQTQAGRGLALFLGHGKNVSGAVLLSTLWAVYLLLFQLLNLTRPV